LRISNKEFTLSTSYHLNKNKEIYKSFYFISGIRLNRDSDSHLRMLPIV